MRRTSTRATPASTLSLPPNFEQNLASYPLGHRQSAILDLVRQRAADGRTFPTLQEIADALGYRHGLNDIETSLLGLAARGMIELVKIKRDRKGRPTRMWALTAAGRDA